MRRGEAKKSPRQSSEKRIVVDRDREWTFDSEEEVVQFFSETIQRLQDEFSDVYPEDDFNLEVFEDPEFHLQSTLLGPDEIWEDVDFCPDYPITMFIKHFIRESLEYFYVVIAYVYQERPTFVFTHFPTQKTEVVEHYRRSLQVFSAEDLEEIEYIDALSSSDELAVGLYEAMLKLRSENDIAPAEFHEYIHLRPLALESPDEIWQGPEGHDFIQLVFIRDLGTEEAPLYYVVVTAEEPTAGMNYVLFSFPTTDVHLVDRYRHGEKLDPDDFIREESH